MKEHKIVSRTSYVLVFSVLLILLGVTVLLFYLDLGIWSIIGGVTIAVLKALLIVLYFMHVRYSSRLTWVFAGAAFVWLAILIGLTLHDYITRPWLPTSGA